jgi:hypothetical protein
MQFSVISIIDIKRRSSFQKTFVQTDGFMFCKFSWFYLKFTHNAGNKFILGPVLAFLYRRVRLQPGNLLKSLYFSAYCLKELIKRFVVIFKNSSRVLISTVSLNTGFSELFFPVNLKVVNSQPPRQGLKLYL